MVLVGLMLFDGLKLAEVLAAEADDVSLTPRGRADHRRAARRSRRRATRRAHDQHAEVLPRRPHARAAAARREPSGPPGRLTRFGADYLLKRIGAEAGLEQPISTNTLRRSYISRAFAPGGIRGGDPRSLGHTDSRTTRRHLTGDP